MAVERLNYPSEGSNPYTWMTLTAGYTWDDEGRMTSLQYPTVTTPNNPSWNPLTMSAAAYTYDANGRLSNMTMATQPFASATYGPAGEMLTLSYGAGTGSRTYNSMLQLTNQSVPGYLNMTYNYSSTANNGRITGSVDGVTGENTSYSYDALNRLTAASNGLWSEQYTYDGFGNLTSKSGVTANAMTATFDGRNHQTNEGAVYEGNGNATWANNSTTFNTFTMENRINNQGSGVWPYAVASFSYDPWGKRVMQFGDPDPQSLDQGSSPS